MAETGYLLTVALVTPLSSYFKRKLKLRTIFLTAIVLCITGCLMAACTLNFPMLMTARILQGAGTGIALPLMFNIILEQSPKSKIGMLMGVGGMVVAVAPALGPTCGRSCRYVHAVALDSLVCGPKTIHQVTPTEEAHINPLHVLCLAVGFVCFVFALDRGGSAVTAVSNGDTSATTQW